jgi:hypothetical protein
MSPGYVRRLPAATSEEGCSTLPQEPPWLDGIVICEGLPVGQTVPKAVCGPLWVMAQGATPADLNGEGDG